MVLRTTLLLSVGIAGALGSACTSADLTPLTTYFSSQMSYEPCAKASGIALNDFILKSGSPTTAQVAAFQSSLDCNDIYQRFQKTPGPSCTLWGQKYADVTQLSFSALVAIKAASSDGPITTIAPNATTVTPTPIPNTTTFIPTTVRPTTLSPRPTTVRPTSGSLSGSMAGNITEEPIIATDSPAPTFATIEVTKTPKPTTAAPSSASSVALSVATAALVTANFLA